MMDVVHADISGEPAQDRRQVIVRTPAQRRLVKIPALVMGPEGVFELVLDVEQPDADRSSEERNRKVHKQEWSQRRPAKSSSRRELRSRYSSPWCLARVASHRASIPAEVGSAGRSCTLDQRQTSRAGGGTADTGVGAHGIMLDIRGPSACRCHQFHDDRGCRSAHDEQRASVAKSHRVSKSAR